MTVFSDFTRREPSRDDSSPRCVDVGGGVFVSVSVRSGPLLFRVLHFDVDRSISIDNSTSGWFGNALSRHCSHQPLGNLHG